MAEETPATSTSDDVAKYKRILSLARSNLEANQATIASKDQQIAQLIKVLEEEKSKPGKRIHGKEDEFSLIPRKILCRVDIEGLVWILVEYEDMQQEDSWKSFENDQELDDFIQRIPGIPLTCPPRCLSAEESNLIMEESKRRVERIVEEFRRYKVRTEIVRKQKDAETRQAVLNTTASSSAAAAAAAAVAAAKNAASANMMVPGASSSTSSITSSPAAAAAAVTTFQYTSGGDLVGPAESSGSTIMDDLARCKQQMKEQEQQWKLSYEKILNENEILRSKGGETLLATQWRGRYEACQREKEELSEKLRSHLQYHSGSGSGSGSSGRRDEFEEDAGGLDIFGIGGSSGNHVGKRGGGSSGGGYGFGESGKMKYVRQMIYKYLCCTDPEVKAHIETALMAIFRMSERERRVIETKRKEYRDTQDTLTSISNFLGSMGPT
mmetsp:Transcript_22680/g.37843  ORF Transcript_22680/g.37843 Transcript_22680/m.37843 type:complete len:439 (-) Transcript_22680:412-1728(-)